MLEFPSSELIKPYKLKGTYIIGYVNLMGGLGIVVGEQMVMIPLAIVHCLLTYIKHNPFTYNAVADQASYDNKMRMWLADMIIFFALVICALEKHPLQREETKSSKVNKDIYTKILYL